MAEVDKNATNYWCKYCKTFVRNSPLERRNHESSPRHQGSLQRFLKDLHKTNERESREKERAKAEVARLNGDSSVPSKPSTPQKPSTHHSHHAPHTPARQATREERKQQMAQLAAMGVVVPEEFRKENAMTGEWERVPSRPSLNQPSGNVSAPKKGTLNDWDSKHDPEDALVTDRKRKPDDETFEDSTFSRVKRKPNWGSDVRQIGDVEAENDLDALLAGSATTIVRKEKISKPNTSLPEELSQFRSEAIESRQSRIKTEDVSDYEAPSRLFSQPDETNAELVRFKSEDDAQDIGSMFKKKKKVLKQNS